MYKDLAPDIYRQILLVELETPAVITEDQMQRYFTLLGRTLDMVIDSDPLTRDVPEYGLTGWVHWITSGSHGYTWHNRSPVFSSYIIYSCKAFDTFRAVMTTRDFFGIGPDKIRFRQILPVNEVDPPKEVIPA